MSNPSGKGGFRDHPEHIQPGPGRPRSPAAVELAAIRELYANGEAGLIDKEWAAGEILRLVQEAKTAAPMIWLMDLLEPGPTAWSDEDIENAEAGE